MEVVNAIAKARFSSARPQRIRLSGDDAIVCELLCLEPGQNVPGQRVACCYYAVVGTGELECDGEKQALPTGQLAHVPGGEAHSVRNPGESRLIVLATSCACG